MELAKTAIMLMAPTHPMVCRSFLFFYTILQVLSLRGGMVLNSFLGVGLIMFVGFIGGRIALKLGLPSLTGYIVMGLLLGPYVGGLLQRDLIHSIKDPVSMIAVSIIAFMLGGDLTLQTIKQIGKKLLNIAIIDSLWTYFLVFLGLFFLANQNLYIALPLAALASSPAPTVVVPIVKELKSEGSFTNILLMVSALEDITCVILISISIAISRPLIDGSPLSWQVIWICMREITGSLLLGGALGFLLNSFLWRLSVGQTKILITLTFIVLGTGLTTHFHFSALITILTMGFVVLNWGKEIEEVFVAVEEVSGPIMLIFFTTAGASLQTSLIPAAGIAVIIYIIVRIISKMSGVYLASKYMGMEREVCTHLPKCLLSQAGTTLGLTMLVAQQIPEVSSQILTVMISAIIFFEIIAPPLTRNSLIHLGESQNIPG